MALTRWTDEDFFAPFFRGFPFTTDTSLSVPRTATRGFPVDVIETDKGFTVKADIPGVSKNDIKVSVEGGILRVGVEQSAEREDTKEEEGARWHRCERSSAFSGRALRLPEAADPEKISAKYENGVLVLDMPKRSSAATKQIDIAK